MTEATGKNVVRPYLYFCSGIESWIRTCLSLSGYIKHTHQERTYISLTNIFYHSGGVSPSCWPSWFSQDVDSMLPLKATNSIIIILGSCRWAANDCLAVSIIKRFPHHPLFHICDLLEDGKQSSFKILTPPVNHKEMHVHSRALIKQKNKNYAKVSILNVSVPTRNTVLLCFQWMQPNTR